MLFLVKEWKMISRMPGRMTEIIKIIDDFKERKKSFYKSILNIDPIDLAYLYARGATANEKALIDEALIEAPPEYAEIFGKYSKNSYLFDTEVKLKERFSEPSKLEQKIE